MSCCGQFHPLLSYKYSFFLPSLTYFLSNKNTVKVVARIVSDYPYYPPALIRVTSIGLGAGVSCCGQFHLLLFLIQLLIQRLVQLLIQTMLPLTARQDCK